MCVKFIYFTIPIQQIEIILSEAFPTDRYEYVDIAKATNSPKSKGKTTRIFTSEDDLDETFWLKYLGEEFRNAVHMEVDSKNNVIPVEKKTPDMTSSNNETEKRKRFARQSLKDKKHIPVESLKYPTEEPEMFYTKTTSKPLNNTNNNHKHFYTNNKSLQNNKNKIFIHNKYKQKIIKVKPSSAIKAIHEPLVVNLPENDVDEHQINDQQIPFVVQMPPVIYHQKADVYSGQKSNLPTNNNRLRRSQTLTHKHLPHTLHHEYTKNHADHAFKREIQQQHSYETLAVPSLSLAQFQPDSYLMESSLR